MSFQILKEMFPYLEINGKKAVEKSFPDFFVKLNQLRKSSDSIYENNLVE
jgi:5-enolpyruvylshikimate-3-phosphate synthase